MTRVGPDQLRILMMAGSPTMILLTESRASRALLKRGMLQATPEGGGGLRISAYGLRALADAMDAGRIEPMLAEMMQEMKERNLARNAKRSRK